MVDVNALRELYDCVSKATGPDRELDAAVWKTTRANELYDLKFTASLDAVEALRQRVLPGSELELWVDGSFWYARLDYVGEHLGAPSEPLSRLLAVLAALIAKEESKNG